jgi:hypothetical protein
VLTVARDGAHTGATDFHDGACSALIAGTIEGDRADRRQCRVSNRTTTTSSPSWAQPEGSAFFRLGDPGRRIPRSLRYADDADQNRGSHLPRAFDSQYFGVHLQEHYESSRFRNRVFAGNAWTGMNGALTYYEDGAG